MLLNALALALSLQSAPADSVVRIALAPSDTMSVSIQGGPGVPVVIVPGLVGGAYTFRKVATALAERGYRVYTIGVFANQRGTRPDSGYTLQAQAARVAATLDSLHVRDVLLVTHALGGSVGYRLAIARPELVGGIVAVEAGPAESGSTPSLRRALKLAPLIKLLGARRLIAKNLRGGLEETAHDRSWITKDLMNRYVDPLARDFNQTLRASRAMTSVKETSPLRPRLPEIGVPVLLLTCGRPVDGV